MIVKNLSTAFTTNRVAESRDFYVRFFDAVVTFDCGWYVNLEFGGELAALQFMSPQQPEHKLSDSTGLIYNFMVEDVDPEYLRLTEAGLEPVMPLEDHPWGDRGFGIQDPNGITLYLFSPREPGEEFRQFFKPPA